MNQPVTKAQLLDILDLLARRIEEIFTDGIILSEGDSEQMLAAKAKLNRRQSDIKNIRKLIQNLRHQQPRKREAEKQRKQATAEH